MHTLTNVIKVVSGCDAESLEEIAQVYELVVKAGVHRASSDSQRMEIQVPRSTTTVLKA